MNILYSVLLTVFSISHWCGCHKSNDNFEPIEVFSFQTSKFQVKDVIDSIVKQDTTLAFQELTDYIDTFIFERSFCLAKLNDPDSIRYFYYFSGDVREWLKSSDSSLLVFSYISINGKSYDAKSIRGIENEKIENILRLFDQRIINPAIVSIRSRPKYDISIIESLNPGVLGGRGVICKEKGNCDTLLLKYIDGGKYTATPLVKRISDK